MSIDAPELGSGFYDTLRCALRTAPQLQAWSLAFPAARTAFSEILIRTLLPVCWSM